MVRMGHHALGGAAGRAVPGGGGTAAENPIGLLIKSTGVNNLRKILWWQCGRA